MRLSNLFRPPYLELKQVIVNLKTGTAFRGVVYKQADGWLVLRSAEIVADRGKPLAGKAPALDGEVLVMRGDVDFIQVTV